MCYHTIDTCNDLKELIRQHKMQIIYFVKSIGIPSYSMKEMNAMTKEILNMIIEKKGQKIYGKGTTVCLEALDFI